MELFQLREKEIFETLKKIKKFDFVVIGGYAVNCYTLPRFSVDCDIVLEDKESEILCRELGNSGFYKEDARDVDTPYHGSFLRYEKKIRDDFKVSMDILVREVLDRQTKATFTAKWVFLNSDFRMLKGKTIAEQLRLRIINPEALVAMKIVSCRKTDIRDVFMIMPQIKDTVWIIGEVSKRCDFQNRFKKIEETVTSKKFRDNLQGVYGYVDDTVFEKYKKATLRAGG